MALYTHARIIQPDGESLVQLHRNVELVDGSLVINDSFHDGFIIHNGECFGPLGAGRYPVDTGFGSLLNGLRHFRTAGRLPGVSIIFIRKQAVSVPWGTGEVLCQEQIIGNLSMQIRVLAGGTALLRVSDSVRFLNALVGLRGFEEMDFGENIVPTILLPAVRGALAKAMVNRSVVVLQAEPELITNQIKDILSAKLATMGLAPVELSVGSLFVHPEDFGKLQEIAAKRIDNAVSLEAEKNQLDALYGGNVYDRTAAQSIPILAANQGMAGSPMSQLAMIPTVLNATGQFGGALNGVVDEAMSRMDIFRPRVNRTCPACGQSVSGQYAFCPHCGAARS